MKQQLFIAVIVIICTACGQSSVQNNPLPTPVTLANTPVEIDTPLVTNTPVPISNTVAPVVPTPLAATRVVEPTATLTATKVAAITTTSGWRFRNKPLPGAQFAHQGTHCANGTDLSGEWVVTDEKTIEGVTFTSRIIVTVNADQTSGAWRIEQFFVVEGVKSLGGVQGSIAQIRLGSDGVVAFDLNVGTPVQAKIIQPDGSETPFDFPMPVTSLKQLEWEPLTGSCP